MAQKIIVCSKLPHGLILEHGKHKVELKGLNSSQIIGATHVQTEMDAELWQAWRDAHKGFAPLKSGAIFEAKSTDEAKGKARDLKDEKTGFEPMPQEALGVKKDDGK